MKACIIVLAALSVGWWLGQKIVRSARFIVSHVVWIESTPGHVASPRSWGSIS